MEWFSVECEMWGRCLNPEGLRISWPQGSSVRMPDRKWDSSWLSAEWMCEYNKLFWCSVPRWTGAASSPNTSDVPCQSPLHQCSTFVIILLMISTTLVLCYFNVRILTKYRDGKLWSRSPTCDPSGCSDCHFGFVFHISSVHGERQFCCSFPQSL
jgi:hypothetical protein